MRMQIVLEANEAEALLALARAELRDPREQARLLLRRELMRRKLLPPETKGRQQAQEVCQHA